MVSLLKNKLGLIISVFIHILILLLPVSILVSPMLSKEIELFVIGDEKPPPVKKPELEKKKIEKRANVEDKVIEPTIPTESAQAVISAPPSPIVIQEKVYVETKAESKDIEFGSAEGPRFSYREMPVYPLLARRLGKDGKVVLRLTIDDKGHLLNVEVIEGAGYGFIESAVEAVRKSTFLPAKKQGKPVLSRALLPIKFTLRRAND